ncbi:MAG TPA: type II toxin-antitoxin system RelE/ParE family toxin [Spirochaetota bacterium]|nr:type II toxin-antitoxin system RelE/ParE family toxin [Spirochaetota bacterium]
MNLLFLIDAQEELDDSFEWYENQLAGLGYELLQEIDIALRRIVSYSDSCALIRNGLRRCVVNRFPYGIIYGSDAENIIIVAIAHLHRKPQYWHERLHES